MQKGGGGGSIAWEHCFHMRDINVFLERDSWEEGLQGDRMMLSMKIQQTFFGSDCGMSVCVCVFGKSF